MNAWAADHKVKNVQMIPDGNGDVCTRYGNALSAREISVLVRDRGDMP